MEDITFSIFNHGQAAVARMQTLLKQFEQEEKIRVRLEMIPWTTGWTRMVEMALYHTGPDISEIGSTWVMDLVRMDALRPFAESEVQTISAGRTYFDACWAGGISPRRDHTIWSVPLGGDARAIFYRRDLLAQAGIAEKTAFDSFAQIDNTLAKLKAAGLNLPLAMPTKTSRNSLHNLASWVWGMGGDFLNIDGTHLEFTNQGALEGFKAYFALWSYLGKLRMDEYESDGTFLAGKAAVTFCGYWLLSLPQAPEVAKNLGVAPLPATSFVGGQHLAVWKHSRKPEYALKLARFLSRKASGDQLYPEFGLPVYHDGWDIPQLTRPGYEIFLQALQHGRSFSSGALWGLVEKRLADIMPEIWNEVLAHPERKDTIIENQLSALAQRLRLTMKS
jgi:multiple sugar transport system substrate-binding protein